MPTEFNSGAAYARDSILANIIGMQNEEPDKDSPEYKVLQKLFEHIVNKYGDLSEPFKG